MNLCTNALQAMARGGVLGVTLERTELKHPRTLLRGVLAPGDYVRLKVSDTGAESRSDLWSEYSIHFSPPKAWARAPGWGCRWFTVS